MLSPNPSAISMVVMMLSFNRRGACVCIETATSLGAGSKKDGIGKTNADHKKFLESEVEALDRWDRYLGWLLGTGLVPEVDQPKVNEIRKGVKETKKKTEEILKMF